MLFIDSLRQRFLQFFWSPNLNNWKSLFYLKKWNPLILFEELEVPFLFEEIEIPFFIWRNWKSLYYLKKWNPFILWFLCVFTPKIPNKLIFPQIATIIQGTLLTFLPKKVIFPQNTHAYRVLQQKFPKS